ncbi:MAG: hypothetical protein WA789_18535 [Candidatus Acidiferrum sp.]
MDKSKDPELRDCVVKLRDDHEVEHCVRLRATSVYEAALRGLARLEKVGWESDGSQVRTVVVEIYEEPTTHTVNVKKLLDWLKEPGKSPYDEFRKEKLRPLAK